MYPSFSPPCEFDTPFAFSLAAVISPKSVAVPPVAIINESIVLLFG